MQPYRSAEWKEFRDEVIRLDGGVCVRCGRSSAEGAVLQVHHKIYFPNRKPWAYSHDCCEALCKACHAAEHGKIPPRFGWECIGCGDLEDLIGSCELCGTSIRYTFIVQHEKWPTLEVGEICCDNITCSQVASDHMDSTRRYAERRKRFISSRRWLKDNLGNLRIRQGQFWVEIVSLDRCFQLRINDRLGKLVFPAIIEAQIKAFEVVESGVLSKYFKKPR